jgi:serine/threonine protein kinase
MIIKSGNLNLELLGSIGKGAFAEVKIANDIMTNQKYAVKILETSKMGQKELELFNTEKRILRAALANNFKNIIKMQNILKDLSGRYYIILEYCNGGSLYDCLKEYSNKNRKPFPEKYVSYLMKEILLGVKSLHDHGIIHRDLKLGNILLKYKSKNNLINQNVLTAEVRITDFNVSYFPNNSEPITCVGTIPDMAPSVLQNGLNNVVPKPYDEKIDIWSLGTLCYEMLFNKPLFGKIINNNMYANILNANFTIPNTISPQAKSFLNCMLQKEGVNRLSVSELLNHEFIKKNNIMNINNITFNEINISNSNSFIQQSSTTTNLFSSGWEPSSTIVKSDVVINIFFKDYHYKHLINIVTTLNTKIKDLIESYFYRINRPDLAINYNKLVQFKFNGKNLNINNSLNKFIKDLEIMNGSVIEVIYSSKIK